MHTVQKLIASPMCFSQYDVEFRTALYWLEVNEC